MKNGLELYKRISATKENEETEQKKPKYIKVYHKNGMEWKAASVKLGHFKNINGTQGKASYIIKFMDDGKTRYYPREDIVNIIPIWKGEE